MDKETIKLLKNFTSACKELNKACDKVRSVNNDNIWKDPKVEFPEKWKNIIAYGYCNLNKEYYTYIGFKDNNNVYNMQEDRDLTPDGFKKLKKWCYEEDLIKQAGDE